MLPLYRDFQLQEFQHHPGLLFDKFADGWSSSWNEKLDDNAKKNFFAQFSGEKYGYLKSGLDAYLDRQEELVRHLCGRTASPFLHLKTDWRFVSGLGSGHPYETGFIWHRTLGVPYLPGSSVKGMMRAWAEQWAGLDAETLASCRRLFGYGSDANEGIKDEAGSLIVFDALPAKVPRLELDILNPHYGPYYQDPEHTPPADYFNPVPVFFLTVAPDQPFRFCLAPRPGAPSDNPAADVQTGIDLLRDALETIGAGGKTAVGYGVMLDPKKLAEQWLEDTLKSLKSDKDLRGQPEENLWKKALATKWLTAPKDLQPVICSMVKQKWQKLGLNWKTPKGGSAEYAKRIYTSKGCN